MENGVIDQSYKIINPATEVLNLPPDDEVEICLEISESNDFDSQLSQFNSSNRTPIENIATTPTLNTAANPKHHSDDIETHSKLVEDKLLSKIAALKSHLLIDIFDWRNDIMLLKENNEKEKPADSNNKKDELLLFKEKIKFLESKNSFLKSDISIKQKVIDSILEHDSNLLNHQCCRVSENGNNEIYRKSSENKEKKFKKSPDKNKNRDSNINNTSVTARKQNDKRSQIEDQDEVKDNKTPKKDIVIIGDSMMKYINAREIYRSSSVNIRSHLGATTEDLIDYVRPTAPKKPKWWLFTLVPMTLQIKSIPCRKLEK